MNNNITNTGIFLKQSAVSLRSKFSDFVRKDGLRNRALPYRFDWTAISSPFPSGCPLR